MTTAHLLASEPRKIDPRLDTGGILGESSERRRRSLRLLIVLNAVLTVWYFTWLLSPAQIGTVWLYALLVAAELFNLIQAAGFWWTVRSVRTAKEGVETAAPIEQQRRWGAVDVLIPVYNEPVDIVEATIRGAMALTGADVTVFLLDDGDSGAMRSLAHRVGARYVTRHDHSGAKAGNINHALTLSSAPLVAVFDCDHVPAANFLTATLGHFDDLGVAFVQTPQYYANRDAGPIAAGCSRPTGPVLRHHRPGKSTQWSHVLLRDQLRIPSNGIRFGRWIPRGHPDRGL
jgi:cellulose synthase (UDP-forming)